MIFDTHTHYDDEAFDADREKLLGSLPGNGVGRIVNVGASFKGARDSVLFSEKYDYIYAAVGVHPDELGVFEKSGGRAGEIGKEKEGGEENNSGEANKGGKAGERERVKESKEAYVSERVKESAELKCSEKVFGALTSLAKHKKVKAIGEIGLDYHGFDRYPDKPSKEVQKFWFRRQLELAIDLKLPAVIHSRNAAADTLEIIRDAYKNGLKCADIHCFSYSRETAEEYLAMGFYLGFGGTLTYEGQKKLTKVLKITPTDRILLETDCPYLTPIPAKTSDGWCRNTSMNLPYVIERLAEIKGTTAGEMEKITWDNANRFYGIND